MDIEESQGTAQVSCIILSSTEARQPSIQNYIEEEYANSEPLAYTDSQRFPQDDLERLMRKNKKHMRLLERAGELHQRNKDKQGDLQLKRERIKEEKARLQQLRNRRKQEYDEKKERLLMRKSQLQLKLDNQNTRIKDLQLTLSLLKSLNQREITHIHNQATLSDFQGFISQQCLKLQHHRTAQKIRLILEKQQDHLLNLLSIQQQLK